MLLENNIYIYIEREKERVLTLTKIQHHYTSCFFPIKKSVRLKNGPFLGFFVFFLFAF